jgi:hypothetical protein
MRQLGCGKLDVGGVDVLGKPFGLACARDPDNVLAPCAGSQSSLSCVTLMPFWRASSASWLNALVTGLAQRVDGGCLGQVITG